MGNGFHNKFFSKIFAVLVVVCKGLYNVLFTTKTNSPLKKEISMRHGNVWLNIQLLLLLLYSTICQGTVADVTT